MVSSSVIICVVLLLLTVNTSARISGYQQSDYGDTVNLQSGSYDKTSDQNGMNNQGGTGYNQNNAGYSQNGGNGYAQNGGYPQQQNYPEPTRPSRLKHIIKSAVQGAIMGAAASFK